MSYKIHVLKMYVILGYIFQKYLDPSEIIYPPIKLSLCVKTHMNYGIAIAYMGLAIVSYHDYHIKRSSF